MVADKYIKPTFLDSGENYLHNGVEIVYVACTWMKSCQDEEEGKKVVIKIEIVNSTLALFYLQTNPQVCHLYY